MLLFMVAMVLANTGGNMYGPLLPLYLKSLNASVVQIGLFFTLSQIVPLALQILGGWISDSLGRLRSIAMERARTRMMEDVKTADVVITNPDHISIAIQYVRGEMFAPKIVERILVGILVP